MMVLLAAMPGPPASGSQIIVAPIMERMARAFEGMRSMHASLNQQKTYGQLGISDPSEQGVLYIKRKNNRDIQVRIEIRNPAERVITVKDNKYILFQPAIKQAIEGQVSRALGSGQSGVGLLSLFVGGAPQITRDYQIAAVADEVINGRRATHLPVINRPSIVLADEPTGSLDSENSQIVLQMLQDLNRQFHQTIVIITHNPDAASVTDRILRMRDGRIFG